MDWESNLSSTLCVSSQISIWSSAILTCPKNKSTFRLVATSTAFAAIVLSPENSRGQRPPSSSLRCPGTIIRFVAALLGPIKESPCCSTCSKTPRFWLSSCLSIFSYQALLLSRTCHLRRSTCVQDTTTRLGAGNLSHSTSQETRKSRLSWLLLDFRHLLHPCPSLSTASSKYSNCQSRQTRCGDWARQPPACICISPSVRPSTAAQPPPTSTCDCDLAI